MKIVAKTIKGKEFVYNVYSVHAVPAKSASKICDFLNDIGWKCGDCEVWKVYEIDEYCTAYDVAQFQKMSIRRGNLYHYTAYTI